MECERMAAMLTRILVVAALSTAALPALHAQDAESLRTSPKLMAALTDVVARSSTSTVRIRCAGKDAALGTIVAADGWVLTKFSGLKGDAVFEFKDGRTPAAKVIGVHKIYDLAMLNIE